MRSPQLLVTLALVLTAPGCADETLDVPRDRPAPTASSAPTTSATPSTPAGEQDSKEAVSVTFRRSGGLNPTDEIAVFAVDEPPPSGQTKAAVRAVLEAASDPELVDVDIEPLPKEQCCDRQTYVISVRWDDGSSRTYTSIDGLEQPQAFEELLTKVA